uniref:Uncharacterized protein n=1 Tax=Anguilla anguilla TaxID=7936 RepID=A0A0E9Q5R2_ANGAN
MLINLSRVLCTNMNASDSTNGILRSHDYCLRSLFSSKLIL